MKYKDWLEEWLKNYIEPTIKARTFIRYLDMNLVWRMIRNEKYIGVVRSNEKVYTDVIPAIVDEGLFRECNRIMDGHKHKSRECKAERPYILSGKLFCGYCGSFMIAEAGTSKTGKVHHYYKCSKRKRKLSACGKKNYRQKIWKILCLTPWRNTY